MLSLRSTLYFIRRGIDHLLITALFIIAALFTHGANILIQDSDFLFLLFIINVGWVISSNNTDLYDEFRSRNFSYELVLILQNNFILSIISIVFLFSLKDSDLSRTFILSQFILISFFISLEKYLLRMILYYLRRKGKNIRSMIIIGAGNVGRAFNDIIKSSPHYGYKILGYLDDNELSELNGLYLGKITNLENILLNGNIDNLAIALPGYAENKIHNIIEIAEKYGVRVRIISNYFKFVSGKFNVSMFGPFPVIAVRDEKINLIHWRLIKRFMDTLLSFIISIIFLSWLIPFISLLIKIESKGPALFKQERWGRGNKKILIYKFRSMYHNGHETSSLPFMQASKNDPRITKVGRFLRKTNLDELPQFINVLKGEMSIIGPRPHPLPLELESKEKINKYMVREFVKPGISGWAQVNGFRGETKNIKLMQKRIDYDIWYIENWSLFLDPQIFILTIWNMIKGDPNAY